MNVVIYDEKAQPLAVVDMSRLNTALRIESTLLSHIILHFPVKIKDDLYLNWSVKLQMIDSLIPGESFRLATNHGNSKPSDAELREAMKHSCNAIMWVRSEESK